MVIDQAILRQNLALNKIKVWWVNNNHMPSDALTKLSDNARLDLLYDLLHAARFRISYCEVSGRRENKPLSFDSEAFFLDDLGSELGDEDVYALDEDDDNVPNAVQPEAANVLTYNDPADGESADDPVDDWLQDRPLHPQ